MKTRLISIVLLLSLVLTLVSCAAAESGAGDAPGEAGEPSSGALHILLDMKYLNGAEQTYGNFASYMKRIVAKYNKSHETQVVIDPVKREILGEGDLYGSTDEVAADYNDIIYTEYQARKTSKTEPDIILFSAYHVAEEQNKNQGTQYTEWYKYLKNGDLADLTPFMESDESYNAADYVGAVMDGGKYGGRQAFLPLLYQTFMYSGISERSAENGAPSPGSYKSFGEFWEQVNNAVEYASQSGVKPFSNTRMYEYLYFPLYTGEAMIDAETGKFNGVNASFRTMTKALLATLDPFGCYPLNEKYGSYTDLAAVNNGDACMGISLELGRMGKSAVFDYIAENVGMYDYGTQDTETTPYAAPLPAPDDPDKAVASITFAMGVSETSANKQAAYDFIRFCMNDEEWLGGMLDDAKLSFASSYPVKLKSIKNRIELALERDSTVFGFNSSALPEVSEKLNAEITDIAYAAPYYHQLNSLFRSSFYAVANGNKDAVAQYLQNHSGDLDSVPDELCEYIQRNLDTFWAN